MILTRHDFNTRLAALIAETDLSACGFAVKPHEEKATGEDGKVLKDASGKAIKTGKETGMYATGVFKMPGTTAVILDGETFYSKNVAFKIDAFKLAPTADAVAVAPKAQAATVSAADLKARLAAISGNKPQVAATIQ